MDVHDKTNVLMALGNRDTFVEGAIEKPVNKINKDEVAFVETDQCVNPHEKRVFPQWFRHDAFTWTVSNCGHL